MATVRTFGSKINKYSVKFEIYDKIVSGMTFFAFN